MPEQSRSLAGLGTELLLALKRPEGKARFLKNSLLSPAAKLIEMALKQDGELEPEHKVIHPELQTLLKDTCKAIRDLLEEAPSSPETKDRSA